jgi:hypothetical protein
MLFNGDEGAKIVKRNLVVLIGLIVAEKSAEQFSCSF